MTRKLLWLATTTLLLCSPLVVHAQSQSFDSSTGTIIDKRWQSGLPLGGIGVGKIELLTDGSFGNFTNQHNWDRPYGWAKGAFAAVRVQTDNGAPVAKILRLTSADEYAGVENIAHTHMQGWFPTGQIDYSDASLPITVELKAFSPLIPHDVKDSGLPVASLDYDLSNPTKQTVHATLALAWPNLLGWGGRGGVEWNNLSGDSQTPVSSDSLTGLQYTSTQSYQDQEENVIGEDFVGVRSEDGVQTQTCASWDASDPTPSFWPNFAATGTLANGSAQPSQPAGVVAATVTLAPGESRTLHFYVAWAMPHLVMVNQAQTFTGTYDTQQADVPSITNQGSNRWSTNRGMNPGDHLILDLGSTYTPTGLEINSGSSGSDYPRGLKVETSSDGNAWTTVAQKTTDDMMSASKVALTPASCRYIKLTQLGSSGLFWSIYGLAVDVQGQSSPIEPVSAASYLEHADFHSQVQDAGHYWQNWWDNAESMASYVDQNRDQLQAGTLAWQTPVMKASIPFWLKLKLINCAFPMFSNTVLTKDGRFSVLESPIDMGGALGTMDQRMAAHAFLTAFFPELDRTELEQYAACQQTDGRITHFDGNVHQTIVDPNVGYGITDWPDLSCGWVSQVVKLYRWTGDTEFLERTHPHIEKAMTWLRQDGADDDLIPSGGSTYDYETLPRGAFIYSASCYLAALRAASAVSTPEESLKYDALTTQVQKSVMRNLWTGTYFRKWRQPSTGRTVDDSFVSNLAGDWFTHITGLRSTLDASIIHQSIEQTIARHQKPFFPIPPMQVTADGQSTTSNCYTLQHEPYLGCEAIYDNFVDDGLDTIKRIYFSVWEENHSPWDESLCYDAANGRKGGLPTYMTCPTTWFVLDALAGTSIDIPDQRLYISPRLTTDMQELHVPVYFSRFWGWLDYVPADHKLTLTISKVYSPNADLQQTLYHIDGPGGDAEPESVTIRSVAANGDSLPIKLLTPFNVREGAILDLSPLMDRLAIPQKSDVVTFEVKAPVHRLGLPSDNWKLIDNLHDNPQVSAIFGQDALDGDSKTRWTTGKALQPGDAFTLDMASPQTVSKLVLDSSKSPSDYPAGYRLESSLDGQSWNRITEASQAQTDAQVQNGVLTITFPPISARYLRVTSLGGHGLWWSVYELYAYGS